MIANDQIEAAARALHQHVVNWSGRGREWDSIPPLLQARFRDEAKAALVAAAAVRDSE